MWHHGVRQRLANHLRGGTAEAAGVGVGTNLTSSVQRLSACGTYLDPNRDKVAHRAPHLLVPSALLPPGHAISGELPSSRTPIFAYRSHTGEVRAYVNQCRHRGSELIKTSCATNNPHEPIGVGKRVVCPYHSWTYDADSGRLVGVPGQEMGFPCLNKADYGLSPVPVTESAGGIFVGGEVMRNKRLWATEEVHSELDPILGGGSKQQQGRDQTAFIAYKEWDLKSNWQLVVETFLEAYHVSSLHSNTLNLVAHSNIMATDTLDDERNFRMTVPLRNFDVECAGRGGDLSLVDFLGQTTNNYFIFPNVAVTLFKRFVLFLSITPKTSNESLVRAWGVKHNFSSEHDGPIRSGDNNAADIRDYNAVIAGIEEDWLCSEGIQRGLEGFRGKSISMAEDELAFTYGKFESNNVSFLENVGRAAEELHETTIAN